MLKDRRKNKDLRDMIDSVEKALWEDTQSKCQCGKMGYFPKGKCVDCADIKETYANG